MTAAVPSPAPTLAGGDVCRVTISAPHGRADLAIPASTTMAVLLPVLLRHVPASNGRSPVRSWVLQRLGEKPLGPAETPQSAGLRDGDVIYLRPANAPLPGLEFDDIADGVAHAINGRHDRWRPELTGRLLFGLAYLVLAVLALALLGPGLGQIAAICAGSAAVVLAVCSALEKNDHVVSAALGVCACVFAALAGLTALRGSAGVFAPHAVDVALGAVAACVVAAVLLAVQGTLVAALITMLVTSIAVAVAAALTGLFGLSATGSAALVAVLMFLPAHWWPRLSLRLARLRVSPLPRNAEELQQGIDPEPEERVTRRVAAADSFLIALTITSALMALGAFVMLVNWVDWSGWALTVALSAALLLRARSLAETWQRVSCVVAGTVGPALVLINLGASMNLIVHVIALFVLLVAGALFLVGARRLPNARLLPVWGHTADILEVCASLAVLPILLQVLNVYMYFRALAG